MSPTTRSIEAFTSVRLRRDPVDRLSRTRTSAPEATSERTRFEPMKPAPPVTRTVTSVPSQSSRREQFRVDRFHSAYRGSDVELSRAAPGGCPELRKQLRVAKKADDGARKRRGIA